MCDLHGVPQHGARGLSIVPGELLVSITVFAAEDVAKETHHVDVRRRNGPHHQFQRFYVRFRELVHAHTHTHAHTHP